MSRCLLAGLFAAALVAAAGLPGSVAQDKKEPKKEKKEQPKKLERIAIADPNEAKKDPDFAIQGEYEGTFSEGKEEKIGAQVVAKGGGNFAVKFLRGGLPGAGWNQEDTKSFTATRVDGKVVIRDSKTDIGTIGDGKLSVKDGRAMVDAKRVERKSKSLGQKPPAGGVVLFGGPGDEKNWTNGKLVELSDGKFLNMGIKSNQKFGAFKAHIEFRTPWMPNSSGQGRGNSGVYLQDRYELQVLDSFGLTGENNECGGFYQAHKPLVNMCYPPLSWQTYDIEFTPARFDDAGKKIASARATVYHNGVKIHENVEFKGPSGGGQAENPMPGPFQFQNHGDPLAYNNVWVVEVK
jgi:hypothetical protein